MNERAPKPRGPITLLCNSRRFWRHLGLVAAVFVFYVASIGPAWTVAIRGTARPGQPDRRWLQPAVNTLYAPLWPLFECTNTGWIAARYIEWCYSISMRVVPPTGPSSTSEPAGTPGPWRAEKIRNPKSAIRTLIRRSP